MIRLLCGYKPKTEDGCTLDLLGLSLKDGSDGKSPPVGRVPGGALGYPLCTESEVALSRNIHRLMALLFSWRIGGGKIERSVQGGLDGSMGMGMSFVWHINEQSQESIYQKRGTKE